MHGQRRRFHAPMDLRKTELKLTILDNEKIRSLEKLLELIESGIRLTPLTPKVHFRTSDRAGDGWITVTAFYFTGNTHDT